VVSTLRQGTATVGRNSRPTSTFRGILGEITSRLCEYASDILNLDTRGQRGELMLCEFAGRRYGRLSRVNAGPQSNATYFVYFIVLFLALRRIYKISLEVLKGLDMPESLGNCF
jgi:hypothetical protein